MFSKSFVQLQLVQTANNVHYNILIPPCIVKSQVLVCEQKFDPFATIINNTGAQSPPHKRQKHSDAMHEKSDKMAADEHKDDAVHWDDVIIEDVVHQKLHHVHCKQKTVAGATVYTAQMTLDIVDAEDSQVPEMTYEDLKGRITIKRSLHLLILFTGRLCTIKMICVYVATSTAC